MKNTPALEAIFRALADSKRREILFLLRDQDMTIGQIVERFDVTRAAVKKHLCVLEDGNLISVVKRGRERINRLEPRALQEVDKWLAYFSQFWDGRLSSLQTLIDQEKEQDRGHIHD